MARPQWGNVDNAANSVIWAASQLNKSPTSANAVSLYENTTANAFITNAIIGQFGVDTNEQRASNTAKPTHAGWVLRREGTGGRAGRIFYETLVAMGSMTGDGSDDTQFPDYRLVISTQPVSSTLGTSNAVNFIVVASSVPSGATISYKWQKDGGPSSQTWADIANTGIFQSANGNTTATLSISNNATLNANNFRVIVTATGANTIYSANARITVV
jgi:hypothetical protein